MLSAICSMVKRVFEAAQASDRRVELLHRFVLLQCNRRGRRAWRFRGLIYIVLVAAHASWARSRWSGFFDLMEANGFRFVYADTSPSTVQQQRQQQQQRPDWHAWSCSCIQSGLTKHSKRCLKEQQRIWELLWQHQQQQQPQPQPQPQFGHDLGASLMDSFCTNWLYWMRWESSMGPDPSKLSKGDLEVMRKWQIFKQNAAKAYIASTLPTGHLEAKGWRDWHRQWSPEMSAAASATHQRIQQYQMQMQQQALQRQLQQQQQEEADMALAMRLLKSLLE